jgi:lipoprotein NlpI
MEAVEAFNLGVKYLDHSDFDMAIVAFSEAIRLDPEYAQAYNGRAVAFGLGVRVEEALADSCQAIRLDPEDPEFYRTRAYIYRIIDKDDKAEEDLAKAGQLEGAG